MRQMVLRFFLYIWGAILGTTVLVIALAISFGPPPPGYVPVESASDLMLTAAREAFAREGRVSVEQLLSQDASFKSRFFLQEDDDEACGSPWHIGKAPDGRCLALQLVPTRLAGLEVFVPFITPLVVGAVISLLISLALARRFVRPIQRIGSGLAQLAQGHFGQRIGPELDHSEPAIASVGRAFDTAAGKLQELTEGRTRLFHDISHEIRSPLARLQAEVALLQQTPSRLQTLLPRMETDIARMDQLVGEILTLARLERSGEIVMNIAPIDLIDILDPILRDAELEGKARQISLSYTGPDQLVLACDPELLHRAFENIIRNALRFAPDSSTVDVRVEMTEQMVEIVISDRGPGVDEAQLLSIFQPFVRETEGRGTGLGLAIASNAIRLHGGTIRASNREGGGLVVQCRILILS